MKRVPNQTIACLDCRNLFYFGLRAPPLSWAHALVAMHIGEHLSTDRAMGQYLEHKTLLILRLPHQAITILTSGACWPRRLVALEDPQNDANRSLPEGRLTPQSPIHAGM